MISHHSDGHGERVVEALKEIVEFWPLLAFFGAMVWWAASMSKDVHILKKDVHALKDDVHTLKDDVHDLKGDVHALKGDMSALKDDVREIKQLILKQVGALSTPAA